MCAALVYDPAMESYRFGESHPMKPERFSLAVDLIRAWGLTDPMSSPVPATSPAEELRPVPACDDEITLAHDPALVAAVRAAGGAGGIGPGDTPAFGIGPGDTPAFPEMHEAAALVVGGTILALDTVLGGRTTRAFNPAGGMHHAHRDRVAGFCIYNDCVVAIRHALHASAALRVAYVDIDAHHGDGVEEAFRAHPGVLTLSVHESGQYLYPGTGSTREIGSDAGLGFTLNAPMPPYAGDECYRIVLSQVIAPALRTFAPDVIVLQGGADTHRDDPLTHLDLTVAGYVDLIAGILALSDELCGGRLCMTGGGGYEYRSAVPRMWASAFAVLNGAEIPPILPQTWLSRAGGHPPTGTLPADTRTFFEPSSPPDAATNLAARQVTEHMVAELRKQHPLLG